MSSANKIDPTTRENLKRQQFGFTTREATSVIRQKIDPVTRGNHLAGWVNSPTNVGFTTRGTT